MNQPGSMKQVKAKMISRFCVLAGRMLILFSAVLLAITPVTAHFWTFDRFLRGGQDFEMGLLSVLAVLCLVLLLADSCRETISLLIALRKWLADTLPYETANCLRRSEHRFSAVKGPPSRPSLAAVPLALRILLCTDATSARLARWWALRL